MSFEGGWGVSESFGDDGHWCELGEFFGLLSEDEDEVQHGSEHPFVCPEQPDVRIHQHPRDETGNGIIHDAPKPWKQALDAVSLRPPELQRQEHSPILGAANHAKSA